MPRRKAWYASGSEETFDGVKTIKLSDSGNEEWEINSPIGFIWRYSDTQYKACVLSHTIANRYLPEDKKAHRGDESIFVFPKAELQTWIKRLKIKNNRVAMVARANNFGKE